MKLKFKKGLSLNLEGGVRADAQTVTKKTDMCAIVPDDFPGFVPKPAVKDGDEVACGQPLLFDKAHPEVKILSPMSGRVKGVVRGDRRKILRVEVEQSEVTVTAPTFSRPADAASAKSFLAASGMLAFMRQRPYDIVPNPADTPRDIFITAIDSAPLAATAATYGTGIFTAEDYQLGVDILRMVTKGKVYLATDETWPFGDIKGAEMLTVAGPYPAGNVSVQIEAVAPVNKGETVWTLDGSTLARIGHIASTGKFFPETVKIRLLRSHPRLKTIFIQKILDRFRGRTKLSRQYHTVLLVLRYHFCQTHVHLSGNTVDRIVSRKNLTAGILHCGIAVSHIRITVLILHKAFVLREGSFMLFKCFLVFRLMGRKIFFY